MGMSTPSYDVLQDSNVSWICDNCGKPNFANSTLFSSTFLDLSNIFSCLSDNFIGSGIFDFPLATSSPQDETGGLRSTSTRSSTSCASPRGNSTSNVKSPNKKPKPQKMGRNRQSLKCMVVNFCSVRSKSAELAVCIDNYHPDIIIGTETHLDPSVHSSEFIPPDFSVVRKDREKGNPKGGVLIAYRKDLIATHRIELDNICEAVWITIKIQGAKDLTIGSFYRSHKFGNTPEYFDALRDSIGKIKKSSNGHVWLGGDFNLPSVNCQSWWCLRQSLP
jgi:hypothetical protein